YGVTERPVPATAGYAQLVLVNRRQRYAAVRDGFRFRDDLEAHAANQHARMEEARHAIGKGIDRVGDHFPQIVRQPPSSLLLLQQGLLAAVQRQRAFTAFAREDRREPYAGI